MVPTLLTLTDGSVVVADPSSELAAMTARHRATLGTVIFLNPFGSVFTQETGMAFPDTGFNPLSILDP
ncbi:TraG/TraD family protein, partial [Amaricoccus sp. HAR-UPW-R2A-40]